MVKVFRFLFKTSKTVVCFDLKILNKNLGYKYAKAVVTGRDLSLQLTNRRAEFQSIDEIEKIPFNTRGIYVLYFYRPKIQRYDVVYIGMASGLKTGIKGRLKSHKKTKDLLLRIFICFF